MTLPFSADLRLIQTEGLAVEGTVGACHGDPSSSLIGAMRWGFQISSQGLSGVPLATAVSHALFDFDSHAFRLEPLRTGSLLSPPLLESLALSVSM